MWRLSVLTDKRCRQDIFVWYWWGKTAAEFVTGGIFATLWYKRQMFLHIHPLRCQTGSYSSSNRRQSVFHLFISQMSSQCHYQLFFEASATSNSKSKHYLQCIDLLISSAQAFFGISKVQINTKQRIIHILCFGQFYFIYLFFLNVTDLNVFPYGLYGSNRYLTLWCEMVTLFVTPVNVITIVTWRGKYRAAFLCSRFSVSQLT